MIASLRRNAALIFATVLMGCSQPQPILKSDEPAPLDLSGHWEMNYGRSEHVEDRLRSLSREFQRDEERRQRQAEMDRRVGRTVSSNTGLTRRAFNAMIRNARLADMITRSQTLEIEQLDIVKVHRSENFTLICQPNSRPGALDGDSLGAEGCFWDGKDLLYQIRLPDNLRINHRFTLAPLGDQLRIATTVQSGRESPPFTLNRFYFRYEPPPAQYHCEFTLSRGQVCSREGNGP